MATSNSENDLKMSSSVIESIKVKPKIAPKPQIMVNNIGRIVRIPTKECAKNELPILKDSEPENSDVDNIDGKEHSESESNFEKYAPNELPILKDSEPENSDVDNIDGKEHSESESNFEMDILSKPHLISQECLNYLNQVYNCLKNLLEFKEELDKEFPGDADPGKNITNVYRDIKMLRAAYELILETVGRLQARDGDQFYLYDVLLDPVVSNLLKVYKPFLSQYATNAKWMGDFSRENQACLEACNRARTKAGIKDNVTIDNCLYTVFNSLFSLELMFDRFRKCFEESSEQFQRASCAKNLISALLSAINTNQDQANFLLTQKELNLLTGRSRNSKINTRFLYKGIATKFARRDDKPLSRQLVLFTDCLYVTLLPGNIVGSSSVRQELSTSTMKVDEIQGEDADGAGVHSLSWGLSIQAREAVQDFFFESEQTRTLWRDKILIAIREDSRASQAEGVPISGWLSSLGKEAPRWQKDTAAGYCNGLRCRQKFSASVRRHHCRADGLLYCDGCCSFRVKLEFERSLESKVCELCFRAVSAAAAGDQKTAEEARGSLEMVMARKTRGGTKTGWLGVRAFSREKRAFLGETRFFCELHASDPFLNLYEKHEDAYHSVGVILLGMEVRTAADGSSYFRGLSGKQFVLQHLNKEEAYLMKAPSADDCKRWVDCVKERISSSLNA